TGSPHSAFKLWDEREGAPPHAARARRGGAGAGELVPFCGVHRIGGYAVQPSLPEDDGMPGLTSSQESVESLDFEVEVENERKRGYVDDEDEEDAWDGGIMTVGTAGN